MKSLLLVLIFSSFLTSLSYSASSPCEFEYDLANSTTDTMKVLKNAALYANVDCVEYLLDGMEPRESKTMLSGALKANYGGYDSIFEDLLNNRKDNFFEFLNEKSKVGHFSWDFTDNSGTPLAVLAAQTGSLKVLEMIAVFDKQLLFKKDGDGNTALHVASAYSSRLVVEFLLAKGLKPNQKNRSGDTSLLFSARTQNKKVFYLLLSKGADLKVKNNRGQNAFFLAISQDLSWFEALKNKGLSLNLVDNNGNNLISRAVEHGNRIDLIQFFMKNGVSPHQVNKDGFKPIHLAIMKGDFATTKYLLEFEKTPYGRVKVQDKEYALDELAELYRVHWAWGANGEEKSFIDFLKKKIEEERSRQSSQLETLKLKKNFKLTEDVLSNLPAYSTDEIILVIEELKKQYSKTHAKISNKQLLYLLSRFLLEPFERKQALENLAVLFEYQEHDFTLEELKEWSSSLDITPSRLYSESDLNSLNDLHQKSSILWAFKLVLAFVKIDPYQNKCLNTTSYHPPLLTDAQKLLRAWLAVGQHVNSLRDQKLFTVMAELLFESGLLCSSDKLEVLKAVRFWTKNNSSMEPQFLKVLSYGIDLFDLNKFGQRLFLETAIGSKSNLSFDALVYQGVAVQQFQKTNPELSSFLYQNVLHHLVGFSAGKIAVPGSKATIPMGKTEPRKKAIEYFCRFQHLRPETKPNLDAFLAKLRSELDLEIASLEGESSSVSKMTLRAGLDDSDVHILEKGCPSSSSDKSVMKNERRHKATKSGATVRQTPGTNVPSRPKSSMPKKPRDFNPLGRKTK